jgi:GAF domain-containing protein
MTEPMTEPQTRAELLYEVSRMVTTFTELDPLLRFATRRARELLHAEGCSLLLLDERRHELYFPVSSQTASWEGAVDALEEIRFPADRGVAGWVLREGRAARVDDVTKDARFYSGIDRATGATTRAILCAPLRTRMGNIGVLEVINPVAGSFEPDDLTFLEALAADIATACEKARLYEQLRRETVSLRQVCRAGGFGLAVIGLLFIVAAVYAHLAWALPLRELPSRPALLMGVVLVAWGLVLARIASGWLIEATPRPRLP